MIKKFDSYFKENHKKNMISNRFEFFDYDISSILPNHIKFDSNIYSDYIIKYRNINTKKICVIVTDNYSGIKGVHFLPKKNIVFTSNESSDYIFDYNNNCKIIHIPLLNNNPITESFVPLEQRKYFYSFVGSKTHKVRSEIVDLLNNDNCLVTFEKVNIQEFNSIVANSIFTLCPRGVNVSSYRICEALRYGSIPVYISDDFILPENFEDYGIAIHSDNLKGLHDLLVSISSKEINRLIENGKRYYQKLFTYEGLNNWIYEKLKTLA
ncbi:MAG: exostosin family protein [Saprospiraceae bacterium]|nr:exostosin family protein [Saprospiraceae bacterium]